MRRAITALFYLVFILGAHAHEPYSQLQTKNGDDCCGEDDCAPLVDSAVRELSNGFRIDYEGPHAGYSNLKIHTFIEKKDAMLSPFDDGKYHLCFYAGVRCFFFPGRGF